MFTFVCCPISIVHKMVLFVANKVLEKDSSLILVGGAFIWEIIPSCSNHTMLELAQRASRSAVT